MADDNLKVPLIGLNTTSNTSYTQPMSINLSTEANNGSKAVEILNKIRISSSISERLTKRKQLTKRRRLVSDIMCLVGLLGVCLMIIENELAFHNTGEYQLRFIIKLIITVTTFLLIVLVFYYHSVDIRLYAINNSIDDWKVSLTPSKVLAIIGEAFICLIQPLPWLPDSYISSSANSYTSSSANSYISSSANSYVSSSANSSTSTHVILSVNVILSIFMFTRVYLVCRCLIYHSTIVTDSSSQSIGFLNRVKFNFKFILKAYLTQHPVLSLAVIVFTLFLAASWALRACNISPTTGRLSMSRSMYLFFVSYTTVGSHSEEFSGGRKM
ncbi:unnamed protein product [Didymodactylos carnosus]|uniref:Uncharacterized protein n=1 Tax=Didymodactylos carnosus TaxID=1234261 RepID=A0A8S2V879_9BILA|nr:unnamed protein product [Didymodactylos carnosus]CAF4357316.1 unnamed protein product [Didymodactylos carnosus]